MEVAALLLSGINNGHCAVLYADKETSIRGTFLLHLIKSVAAFFRKIFCVIFSNIFSLGNPQYFYCISKSLGWQRLCHPGSLGWQSLCNPWDEMFATFNEEIYETCGAEMLV